MTSFPRLPTFEHLKFYYEDIANSRITRIVVTRPREKGSDLTLLDIEHEGLRTWRINKLVKSIYNHIDGKPYLLLDNAHISSGAVVRILNTLHWLTRLRFVYLDLHVVDNVCRNKGFEIPRVIQYRLDYHLDYTLSCQVVSKHYKRMEYLRDVIQVLEDTSTPRSARQDVSLTL